MLLKTPSFETTDIVDYTDVSENVIKVVEPVGLNSPLLAALRSKWSFVDTLWLVCVVH